MHGILFGMKRHIYTYNTHRGRQNYSTTRYQYNNIIYFTWTRMTGLHTTSTERPMRWPATEMRRWPPCPWPWKFLYFKIFSIQVPIIILYYIKYWYVIFIPTKLYTRYSSRLYAHFTAMSLPIYILLLCFSSHVVLLFNETIWLKPIHDENDDDDDQ